MGVAPGVSDDPARSPRTLRRLRETAGQGVEADCVSGEREAEVDRLDEEFRRLITLDGV